MLYTNMADAEMRTTPSSAIRASIRRPSVWPVVASASLLAGAIIKGDVGAKQAQLCPRRLRPYIRKSGAVDGQQRKVDLPRRVVGLRRTYAARPVLRRRAVAGDVRAPATPGIRAVPRACATSSRSPLARPSAAQASSSCAR